MSSTIKDPEIPTSSTICCIKCSQPRIQSSFCRNHLRRVTHLPPEEHQNCAICKEPYGRRDRGTGTIDSPIRIYSFPGCAHIFGLTCLLRIFVSKHPGYNLCPLCRTPWFHDYGVLNAPHEEARDFFATQIAKLYHADYNTARFLLYKENDYADLAAPCMMAELSRRIILVCKVQKAMKTKEIKDMIEQIQDKAPDTFDERMFDEQKQRMIYYISDPFQFTAWHTWTKDIENAVVHAIMSVRGERLREMLDAQMEGCIASLASGEETDMEILDTVEKQWLKFWGMEEEMDFVRVVLRTIWVMVGLKDMELERRFRSVSELLLS